MLHGQVDSGTIIFSEVERVEHLVARMLWGLLLHLLARRDGLGVLIFLLMHVDKHCVPFLRRHHMLCLWRDTLWSMDVGIDLQVVKHELLLGVMMIASLPHLGCSIRSCLLRCQVLLRLVGRRIPHLVLLVRRLRC